MKSRVALACLTLLGVIAAAAPVAAGIAPYVRFDYAGNQLRMTDGNNLIQEWEDDFQSYHLPADFKKVGPAYGPSLSAGFWLLPVLRVGALYSYQRSILRNGLDVPGNVLFVSDLDFRMTEIGGEAALRFKRLAGLTFGGSVAHGRAELIERYFVQDSFGGMYDEHGKSEKTRTTYGAFIGLDQTNESGVAGFVRAGFQYRDVGRMPSHIVSYDGSTTTEHDSESIWLDYSGYYVKIGIGFDGGR